MRPATFQTASLTGLTHRRSGTDIRRKMLLHLASRRRGNSLASAGFTLIELMVVIVIVAILMAIALPNFLNQTSKAKITEAKTLSNAALKEAQARWAEDGATGLLAWKEKQSATGDGNCPLDTKNFIFTCDGSDTAAVVVEAKGTPDSGDLDGDTVVGKVNVTTGKISYCGSAPTMTACP